jgi:hypothetical protein
VAGVAAGLSVGWGIQVHFKGDKPRVWMPNARDELEPAISGQRRKMAEEMRARIEAEKPPAMLDIMLTMVDQGKRYPMQAQVKADANWHKVASSAMDGIEQFPAIPVAYNSKNANGKVLSNMDETDANLCVSYSSMVPVSSIPQSRETPERSVTVNVSYHHLPRDRKYMKCARLMTISSTETEQEVLLSWSSDV